MCRTQPTQVWSATMNGFVAHMLIKDNHKRPSAADALKDALFDGYDLETSRSEMMVLCDKLVFACVHLSLRVALFGCCAWGCLVLDGFCLCVCVSVHICMRASPVCTDPPSPHNTHTRTHTHTQGTSRMWLPARTRNGSHPCTAALPCTSLQWQS
jgi:hypothetical protein